MNVQVYVYKINKKKIKIKLDLQRPQFVSGTSLEKGTSSIEWAQLSRLLPEGGDRIKSPKHYF
jgi:hypothetical protein